MFMRMLVAVVALAFAAAMPISAFGGEREQTAVLRDEDLVEETAYAWDDDGDTDTNSRSGFTSGQNSNDKTDSRETPVTRDRDRSRGDLTRDRTKDGPGGQKRDWTKNKTNDRSRRDTR